MRCCNFVLGRTSFVPIRSRGSTGCLFGNFKKDHGVPKSSNQIIMGHFL